ncbi:MAG TPA: ABC transporter substrate-binding protein [Anaerolineae bacterium]|nr:ABC transporter substrate-binding protein [Anaerolineae bacterium]
MDDERRRRRWSLVLVIVLAVLTFATGLWVLLVPGEPAVDKTWERIQQEGVMRVAVDASYPPFEFFDEGGNLAGYDIDLAHELGDRFGVDIEFVIISFDGLYDALRVERVDLILSALPFDLRLTEDVTYSHSYFNAGQVLVVREEETIISSVEDLRGRRVGVEWGSMGDVEARELLRRMEFELYQYPAPAEALGMLAEAEIDAVIADAVSVYQFHREHGGVKIAGPPVTDDPYVIATLLNSFILQERLNEAVLELSANGFLDQLRVQWF